MTGTVPRPAPRAGFLFGLVLPALVLLGGSVLLPGGAAPGSAAVLNRAVRPDQAVPAVPVANSVRSWGTAPTVGTGILPPGTAPLVGMAATAGGDGYWLVGSDGGVFAYGGAGFFGSAGGLTLARPVVGMAGTPDGRGYWLVAADGGIFAYGDAGFYGSTGGIALNRPVVGLASTPDGRGYWLVAADGGIFAYGDAGFYGSTGSLALNRPVVGLAATPDGRGYWLVAADGGIFAYGDAGFYGSTGSMALNAPVVGLARTPDGGGYWLVGGDGGIFAFGDAPYLGSAPAPAVAPAVGMAAFGRGYWVVYGFAPPAPLPAVQPNSVVAAGDAGLAPGAVAPDGTQPLVGLARTPDGRGYWMVAADGGIFTYGDAGYHGSTGGMKLNRPIVGMAATPDGGGYWLVASDGGVFAFGDAGFYGSAGGLTLSKPVVGLAATPDGRGYWLVASDGGIFAFGDAAFYGSTGGQALAAPIVGMAPSPGGTGYWLVGADGGIFGFGSSAYLGSAPAPATDPVVGLAATPDGAGYWVLSANGAVAAFGDASATIGPPLSTGPLAVGIAGQSAGAGYWVAYQLPPPLPLAGKVVTIDPGHNGLNYTDPSYINQLVWNGVEYETCDTTGTETAGGYTEAQFNWNVATYLEADLQAEGAVVVLTRPNNDGVGPCVTQRAAIGNAAGSAAAISIHADGGPVDGRGFAVLEPVDDGVNSAVIGSSAALGADVRDAFVGTTMPVSTYDGVDGIQPRNNLAGLNLTTVPKVLIECGNMQNATDVSLLVNLAWQQLAAAQIAVGITAFINPGA